MATAILGTCLALLGGVVIYLVYIMRANEQKAAAYRKDQSELLTKVLKRKLSETPTAPESAQAKVEIEELKQKEHEDLTAGVVARFKKGEKN